MLPRKSYKIVLGEVIFPIARNLFDMMREAQCSYNIVFELDERFKYTPLEPLYTNIYHLNLEKKCLFRPPLSFVINF